MPVVLPDNLEEGDKYLVIAGKMQRENIEGMKRSIIMFVKGDFTVDEATIFCLATFDETTTHPPHFADYFSSVVDVRTLGFSDAGGGLPENIKHIDDLYSTLDCCSSYDWHLLWHVAQSSFGMLHMTGFACARK